MDNRGYYTDYDDYEVGETVESPMGRGISESKPLTDLGKINFITGIAKLEQSYRDILSTNKGSRFMFPEYGSRLYTLLGEPNDFILEDVAEMLVKEDLEMWEPRGIIEFVEAKVSSENNKALMIRVGYRGKDSADINSFVYSVNREVPEMK